ncbi:MAG: MmcQ/YjbR family DNA-binding protein [Candidatus Eisenbacteria bacterium]|uniref:MmcQ/YjbR family DNA-binding protein n=1 Tax=Eiseniibacteriota bacterium TaxID=2212470 RepID=A0A956LVD3_UNCEI|nr:MmcQ/YjbR family DNA-binding protein [Candidatus Eisenbacteria bacterium]
MSKKLDKAFDALLDFALELPGAHEDHPWGETVVKVNKKVFVFTGRPDQTRRQLSFSVKLPSSGPFVLDQPYATPTGYGLGKSGWVTLRFTTKELPGLPLLCEWIEESYRAVAPKKLIKQLDADPSDSA